MAGIFEQSSSMRLLAVVGVVLLAVAAAFAFFVRRRPRPRTILRDGPVPNRHFSGPELARLDPFEPEDEEDDKPRESCPAVPIAFEAGALEQGPPAEPPYLHVDAVARTDRGRKRHNNEDSVLVREAEGLCVLADGMGGHGGGEIASKLAVETIAEAIEGHAFAGKPHPKLVPRASEVARAIQLASTRIHERAKKDRTLVKMGTTVVAARFSPAEGRLYIGHVGDSRCYRFREGKLEQVTTDHTMASYGIVGPGSDSLSRAVGPRDYVLTDVIFAKPRLGDVYLLCSDGLTKAVPDDLIRDVLDINWELARAAERLVDLANRRGGPDNVSVIVMRFGVGSSQSNGAA